MSVGLTPEELAARVERNGLRLQTSVAHAFLAAWEKAGIAEQDNGQWRLTEQGEAMFSGWDVDQPMAGK
jgi:hypothetical protein